MIRPLPLLPSKVLTIPVILRDKKFLNTDNLAHYTHVPEESYSFLMGLKMAGCLK
nr:MAG TPA: hypothetical protein [Bacteriophage sp.]